LFGELSQTTIAMPPLLSLPKEELNDLADGFTEQALQTEAFHNLLQLTDKEKSRLINTSLGSLQEFKKKVLQLLATKSKKTEIHHEILFDPAYNISDPALIQAARLGKKALKDPKTLAMLMHKLQNQNKVATFLGVNRSSVNRRCKEYNIE
jgi:DNA-binding NtrC family response regulator